MHFKTVDYMNTSDWLALAGIGVSAGTLVSVGFGAVWLQHYLENLRLKRAVFRRIVGNVDGILNDCTSFKSGHTFSDRGITAVNEVWAVFNEQPVLEAWDRWHETNKNEDFAGLLREMSAACRLKQYQELDIDEIMDAFGCSCVYQQEGEN